jgi:hypothetical protein
VFVFGETPIAAHRVAFRLHLGGAGDSHPEALAGAERQVMSHGGPAPARPDHSPRERP